MTAHAPLPTTLCLLAAVLVGPTGCKPASKAEVPEPRPVRTVTVAEQEAGEKVVLTGHIQSDDEAALAFRICGRMIERPVNVGDRIETGQELAKLDPENEVNALRSAQANLAAAPRTADQGAQAAFERQRTLLAQGHTPRAQFDMARRRCRPRRPRSTTPSADADRGPPGELYDTHGRRRRHGDGARGGAGRGGAGGADDRHRWRARAGGTRCSTCPRRCCARHRATRASRSRWPTTLP